MICLSNILYSGGTLDENSCIVCMHLSLLFERAVTLHTYDIHVDEIYQHVRLVPLSLQHAIRQKSQQQANVVRFCKIYPIGAFDLTSHRIVVGANSQRKLCLLALLIMRT